MSLSLAIVDYGAGNISSIQAALGQMGLKPSLASQPTDLRNIDSVILPGVGHFGAASDALMSSGLFSVLRDRVIAGMPLLGICLGFQLLGQTSEEAPCAVGLGLLPMASQRLRPQNSCIYKVPHLGWNTLLAQGSATRLLDGITPDKRCFYFSNAYAVAPDNTFLPHQATYSHESRWLALVEHEHIFGVQFHPEKSRGQGLQLLRNFLNLAAEYR